MKCFGTFVGNRKIDIKLIMYEYSYTHIMHIRAPSIPCTRMRHKFIRFIPFLDNKEFVRKKFRRKIYSIFAINENHGIRWIKIKIQFVKLRWFDTFSGSDSHRCICIQREQQHQLHQLHQQSKGWHFSGTSCFYFLASRWHGRIVAWSHVLSSARDAMSQNELTYRLSDGKKSIPHGEPKNNNGQRDSLISKRMNLYANPKHIIYIYIYEYHFVRIISETLLFSLW